MAVQDFLKKWQPSFVGTFGLNEFRNINPLKRVSVSRTSYGKSLIKISEKSAEKSEILMKTLMDYYRRMKIFVFQKF